jgi:hypothetical protein
MEAEVLLPFSQRYLLSIWQVEEHPSPLRVLPSSQAVGEKLRR